MGYDGNLVFPKFRRFEMNDSVSVFRVPLKVFLLDIHKR